MSHRFLVFLVLLLFLVGCSSGSVSKVTGAVASVDSVDELGPCSDSNLWEDKCVGTHFYTCSGTGGAWVDQGEDLGYCPGDAP